jgi:hypothetical protein
MQNHDWIGLFRMFPAEEQSTLVLTTMSGVDLNMEIILRTEPSYLVFRGRVSGITDDGRVFFLPYRQIDYLQINRTVKEAEFAQLFGGKGEEGAGVAPDGAAAVPSDACERGTVPPSSGSFQGVSLSPSHNGLSASPASPSAPAPAVPSRGSVPGVAARLATATGGVPQAAASRPPNAPAPAQSPSGAANGSPDAGEAPTPPRNSILERLRAQRDSILPPRPPDR